MVREYDHMLNLLKNYHIESYLFAHPAAEPIWDKSQPYP